MCFRRLYFRLFPLIMSSNVDNHIKNTGCTNNSFTRKIGYILYFDSDLVLRILLMLISWIHDTKSESYLYLKSLKYTIETGFWVQNHLWICVLELWIHKAYFVIKKLVWNVYIKAFLYTKIVKILNEKTLEFHLLLTFLTIMRIIFNISYRHTKRSIQGFDLDTLYRISIMF